MKYLVTYNFKSIGLLEEWVVSADSKEDARRISNLDHTTCTDWYNGLTIEGIEELKNGSEENI